MKYLIWSFIFVNTFAHAEPYIPNDNDVIATSSTPLAATLTLQELATLFEQTQYAGQTESKQGLLKRYLEQQVNTSDDPEILYYYARVLQREHQFDEALAFLARVKELSPHHVNAALLTANILMVQGKFDDAKSECLNLIGHASIETVTTCSLDAQSQTGKLEESFQALKKIARKETMSLNTRHVLAEMAFRLNKPEQTIDYLETVNLKNSPVSLVVLWADAHLAMNNLDTVLSTLSALLDDSANLEDAILLRLAQAEKYKVDNQSNKWRLKLKERIVLRELRQDLFHASDLAWYYLTIEENQSKARYWANINWKHAKMDSDKQLLKLANDID